MKAHEFLRKDHDALLHLLGTLESALLVPSVGAWLTIKNVNRYLAFELEAHLRAEERLLYPALRLPETQDLIPHLEAGHSQIRRLAWAIEEAVEAAPGCCGPDWEEALGHTRQTCRRLVEVFVHHIFTENQILFPLSEKLIKACELEEIGGAMVALKTGTLSADAYTPGD